MCLGVFVQRRTKKQNKNAANLLQNIKWRREYSVVYYVSLVMMCAFSVCVLLVVYISEVEHS